MPLLEIPHLQVGARGAAIDFLFYGLNADGTRFAQDLTSAVTPFAIFRKPSLQPDGQPALVQVPLTVAVALEGRARYLTADGFLDQAGEWFAQGFVYFTGSPTSFIPSEVVRLLVKHNIRPFIPAPTVALEPSRLAIVAPTISRTP